ncbi:MAG: hypothetical protein R8G01_15965 [Ilumatobacteraceae bacterium]|nr:hypothetical protein [Ilumatobacteraceae bacterium]
MDSDHDPSSAERNASFPVIELPGDDISAVVHPFEAAERVLAAVS